MGVHGTDEGVARSIIDNGFATLSLADAGYYGAGTFHFIINLYIMLYY